MKGADLFIKALENEGVEYIFALPGEENLDLLEAIRTSDKIKLILTRHEQGAGFMAATYGRLTGKVGVCMATLGPGASNLVTPAAYAQLGAMPMLMITGQKPVRKSAQGKFQIIDVVNMMRPLTKYAKQIAYGDHIPSVIREAFRIAMEERPGATHIELPEDIAAEEVPAAAHIIKKTNCYMQQADVESIKNAALLMAAAKRPLLLIGAGANRKQTDIALADFIEKTDIPFLTTPMGKGIVDERHPLYIGTTALSEDDFAHEAILDADLILNVGHDTIEKPPFFMRYGDGKKVIHLHFFPVQADDIYFPDMNVIGHMSDSLHRLSHELSLLPKDWNSALFIEIKKNINKRLATYSLDNRFPILPQRLVTIIRKTLPDDGIIALDNGMYKIWFARNYPAYRRHTLLLDNALATMGAGLPSAMMVKMIFSEKKVISINGDGGFMMNSQELETAVRLNLDLTVIVLKDDSYGMIRWKQQGMGFSDFGLRYSNPDFIKYAESFGAKGYRPESADDFASVFRQCIESKGVHLIDVAIDYTLNYQIFNKIIKEYSKNIKQVKT